MRILYVIYSDFEDTKFFGVKKKIINQIKALNRLNNTVVLAYCHNGYFILYQNEEIIEKIPVEKGFSKYRYAILKTIKKLYYNFDVFYFRFPGSIDFSILLTFKFLFKHNRKVILELPTYPIGGEMLQWLRKLMLNKRIFQLFFYLIAYLVHLFCSRQIHKYLSFIVTFMPYDRIWNTKTVYIENGIISQDYPIIKRNKELNNNINLLGVANLAKWHGYDRLITGLSQYYNQHKNPNLKVYFDIVGEGPELQNLQQLSNKLKVSEYVKFHGMLTNDALFDRYANADIAVSSLGMHRINLSIGSTLKAKEYCSFGIPFVLGYTERKIGDDFPFALKVPSDESAININDVIDFFRKVKRINNYQVAMHEFAASNYDWIFQMKLVVNCLEDQVC